MGKVDHELGAGLLARRYLGTVAAVGVGGWRSWRDVLGTEREGQRSEQATLANVLGRELTLRLRCRAVQ